MGNIGPIANFDVRIGNIQNLFFMLGNSKPKLTYMLNEWAVGKQMAKTIQY